MESKDSSINKDFMDATQLMEENIDSIENSIVVNNEKFLKSSWESLENTKDVDKDLVESHSGNKTIHSHWLEKGIERKIGGVGVYT